MFESFSEGSRLYAQNYAVIEALKGEFQREVDAFLDSVRQEIFSATAAKSLERVTQGYRYWWIGGPDKDSFPQLWVSASAPEIVHPGQIQLTAVAPSASGDQLRALAAVAGMPEFKGVCKAGKGGPWSLFTATVKYGTEQPVQRVSSVAVNLLLALNKVYQGGSRAAGTTGSSPHAKNSPP